MRSTGEESKLKNAQIKDIRIKHPEMSLREIGLKVGISKEAVRVKLNALNLPTRSVTSENTMRERIKAVREEHPYISSRKVATLTGCKPHRVSYYLRRLDLPVMIVLSHEERKDLGICTRCRMTLVDKTRLYCEECRSKHSHNTLKIRNNKKENNECIKCELPRFKSFSLCENHLVKQRKYSQDYSERKKHEL